VLLIVDDPAENISNVIDLFVAVLLGCYLDPRIIFMIHDFE